MKRSKISKEQVKDMYALFKENILSTKEIARIFNLPDDTVRKRRRLSGYKTKSLSETRRKYTIDENF